MKCSICKKKASIITPYGEKSYCDQHFLEAIEKRIRKDVRINQPLDIKKKYFLLEKETGESEIAKIMLSRIFGEHLTIKETKNIKSKNLINARSLDDEASDFVNTYFKNKDFEKKESLNPLRSITKKELVELARILKISYKPQKSSKFLEELENKYSGTLFSVARTKDFINKKKIKK